MNFEEAVQWMYARSGHFTTCRIRMALRRMARATVPELQTITWTSPDGGSCLMTCDDDGHYTASEARLTITREGAVT